MCDVANLLMAEPDTMRREDGLRVDESLRQLNQLLEQKILWCHKVLPSQVKEVYNPRHPAP